jgi:peptide/nickel transport system substrate-binding protein
MFKNDGTATGNIQGSGLGWDANKKIILVRNQNWVESTDPIRKAFPDQIEIDEGYNDPNIATQDILNGQFDFNYDFQIPPAKSQSILSNASQKPLLHNPLIPGLRYISLNTTIHPFTSVHVRRAVAWILNKDAMRKTRGGAIAGPIATHVLSPNLAGFKEAGGNSYDPYATTNEQGDLQKALAEMKLAATQDHEPNINASTGMYTGPAVLMVGSNTGTAPATTTEVANDLKKIGINTRRADYTTNTMYTEWAQIPGKNVAILPNVAWVVDYPDTFTMLAPILGGPGPGGHFPSVKNNNYSLFNDPTFNGLVKDVSATQDVAKRNKLFGELDQRTMDQVPIIPWLWSADALLTSPRVKNFVYYALGDSMDLAVVAVQ